MGASMYQEFIGGDEPWEKRLNQFTLGSSYLFPMTTYVSNDNTSQMTSRQFNMLSNTLNARHDTAKATINNVR